MIIRDGTLSDQLLIWQIAALNIIALGICCRISLMRIDIPHEEVAAAFAVPVDPQIVRSADVRIGTVETEGDIEAITVVFWRGKAVTKESEKGIGKKARSHDPQTGSCPLPLT